MSIKKWLARKGAVGGTARYVAKMYNAIKKQNSEYTDYDICMHIMEKRYGDVITSRTGRVCFGHFMLLESNDWTFLPETLAIAILTTEAGFMENSIATRDLFVDVVLEELAKKEIVHDYGAKRIIKEYLIHQMIYGENDE